MARGPWPAPLLMPNTTAHSRPAVSPLMPNAAGAIIATSINFRLDYALSEINRRHTSFEFQLRPVPTAPPAPPAPTPAPSDYRQSSGRKF